MSGLIVGLVMEYPVSTVFSSEAKFVAVVYADHAWQDGTHAYPAVENVARKTGYSERSVQRYLRVLEAMGMLVIDGKGPHGTTQYHFPLVLEEGKAQLKPVRLQGGDTLTPRQADTLGGDTDSGDSDSGDTSDTRINQPSLNTEEEEETRAPEKSELSPQLQEALRSAEVYHSVWPEFQTRLQNDGWTEADIYALIAWVQHKGGGGGRITTRLRDGSKAPARYYQPDPVDIPEQETEDSPPAEVPAWWLATLDNYTLRQDWRDVLKLAKVYDDREAITIMVPEQYAEVFESWLTTTLERALVGTIGERSVHFVAAETEPA